MKNPLLSKYSLRESFFSVGGEFFATGLASTGFVDIVGALSDLEGSEEITDMHIMEAISFRSMDNKYWS